MIIEIFLTLSNWLQHSEIWMKPDSENFAPCIDEGSRHKSMLCLSTNSCSSSSLVCVSVFFLNLGFKFTNFFFLFIYRAWCKDKRIHSCKCQRWLESDEIWGLAILLSIVRGYSKNQLFSDISMLLWCRSVIWLSLQRLWKQCSSFLHLIINPTGQMKGFSAMNTSILTFTPKQSLCLSENLFLDNKRNSI